ncbi:EAL domain-containing protein [Fictibacillus phosphorivorans]|uniref:EAL domain-containing protein n=1 Tax=Fictibacillus phosphorivorans TaxID=1221500 RepID=UPI0012931F31|nr:EAL domain-containing protein [Fictibacillus phosphorivorans]MQR96889.1 EAL domain-containing protein [Fictibacillus phosphorivorans]
MSCSQCRRTGDFPESGFIHIRTDHPVLVQSLMSLFKENGLEGILSGNIASAKYSNLIELQDVMTKSLETFNDIAVESYYCSVTSSMEEVSVFTPWISFQHFVERMKQMEMYEIIQQQLFTTHSQPIVSLQSEDIYGYEFLLRPSSEENEFKPYELFQYAERTGLQALLDGNARMTSIRNSAGAVAPGVKRFINFLPSSIYDPKHCLATTFKAAAEAGVDPNDLVFEVVETEEIADINHLKSILQAYQEQGMKVALDDLGSGHSTLSVLKELKPDYVKIDRKIISFCDEDESKEDMIQKIVEVAREIGAVVLAEGIERKEEADIALKCGVELAQGYYFGRPVPTESLAATVQ